ncbi:MAG: nuclear transport factor 2 family protein [Chitinophagaceae bacterium]|nr:nuclear transport factor 2 family protein [Chitinophagaceae bacterium]
MKKIFGTLCLLTISIAVMAQSSVKKEINRLEMAEHEALLRADTVRLKQIWDKDFMVNAPINKVSKNRAEVLKLVKSGFISYTSFKRDVEQMLISGDIVISMGSETVVPSKGRPNAGKAIKRRYTNIWQKKKSEWKLIARHANVICE